MVEAWVDDVNRPPIARLQFSGFSGDFRVGREASADLTWSALAEVGALQVVRIAPTVRCRKRTLRSFQRLTGLCSSEAKSGERRTGLLLADVGDHFEKAIFRDRRCRRRIAATFAI